MYSDIYKQIHREFGVNSLDVETVKLNKLFGVPDIDGSSLDHITAPYIIHKNVNKFIANTKAARLNERITRVGFAKREYIYSVGISNNWAICSVESKQYVVL